MRIAVRYFTRTGNTKKLAEAVAEAAGVQAQEVSVPLADKADILFLGSSVYAAGVDDAVKNFLKENAGHIGKIVNISTAALLPSTYKQVKKLAEEQGIQMEKAEFHCRGAFSFMHSGRPNAQDLQNAVSFVKNILKTY